MTVLPSTAPPTARRLTSARPLDLGLTLARLARGPYDPTFRRTPSGEVWRTSRADSGPVTCRLVQAGPSEVVCHAWGPGAQETLDGLPHLLGEQDDDEGFAPPPQVRDTHRRSPGLRIPRTGRVLEALVPAVLEQRVQSVAAWRSWAWLLRRYGEPAPGPAGEAGMLVVPDAATWAGVPSWDWHRAGVDPGRARTVVAAARVARRLEECADVLDAQGAAAAHARLRVVPGVGVWTAAEVAQRALGDADAVSVGDYHLSKAVGWALVGERVDDERMLELLAPFSPHRYRVVRLLEISGRARPPRRGPKLSIQDHRGN
ncbi:DNA-3-methyladenine glycosylase family protein [Cellulosimicrobium marinum]|uniref:DNA-3-methyladenine glycosylase family protein n=1 Tax=Cellulosimicrobium marinum TaxID=1638992 RepID=UPI001E55FA9F|nr:DNA-3-methyladenine glycosylase 2 family protein [Cellulosimicrobium marinum]MCB7136084.1 DNA-3-methyladenine glycosylase 2 family protein [Cellulosimicrobium marinum]